MSYWFVDVGGESDLWNIGCDGSDSEFLFFLAASLWWLYVRNTEVSHSIPCV